MSNTLINIEDILHQQISGFHQYILNDPVHLNYVSQHLCEMLGYKENELLHESRDLYMQLVHPADCKKFSEFLCNLSKQDQTLSTEYRLLKKDGTIIYVKDTSVSKKMEDGTIIAASVLTDISDIQKTNENLKFFNETIPCGFLKYTCEKQPKITYINQTMIHLLRIPESQEGELDYLEMYKSNIFLMIPMEERRRFSQYLNRVYSADAPVAGEISLLRCDGSRIYVFGWVTKCVNEQGEAEFQSICMDVTERHQSQKLLETNRYLKALTDVYDKIFEFNLLSNTVKCLHCTDDSSFKKFQNIAMQIDDALNKYIVNNVDSNDQDRVRSFFRNFCQRNLYSPDSKPPQISYKAVSSTGELNQYTGIFIKVEDGISFYCCRHAHETRNTAALQIENNQLKENMKEMVMRFSDGIAAFEITIEGTVKPLYASENVYEFFGYTKDEWLPLTEKYTPIESFVAYSEASYEEFTQLLKNGEAEFTYFDYTSETERKIKAICSQREPNTNSSRYVMLYSVEDTETNEKHSFVENCTVSIRTFGYFDVFVGDKPIVFRNKKSKELFALLVDRKGGYITSDEAISFLWEEEPVNTVTLARYRKVALRLKNTLEEYGISDILESVNGSRRIVTEKVQCDLYQYLSGKKEYSQLFKGNYLTNYSWGETTLGELLNNLE